MTIDIDELDRLEKAARCWMDVEDDSASLESWNEEDGYASSLITAQGSTVFYGRDPITGGEMVDIASLAKCFVAARNALPALIAEVRELRAFKAQVERVKACDECGGSGVRMWYEGFDAHPALNTCEDCKGLPR